MEFGNLSLERRSCIQSPMFKHTQSPTHQSNKIIQLRITQNKSQNSLSQNEREKDGPCSEELEELSQGESKESREEGEIVGKERS